MAITYNAKGTSYPSFMIGKQGPTLYQSTVPTSPKSGDLYIDPLNVKFDIFNGSVWDSFLTENLANTTYLTSKDPVATGKISLDSGTITSDGSGNITAVGINIGSEPVATQQYVSSSIAAYNPLIGPMVEFGDPKTETDNLTLAFYQSGPLGSTSSSDVEIVISAGTSGTENQGTLAINSKVVDFSTDTFSIDNTKSTNLLSIDSNLTKISTIEVEFESESVSFNSPSSIVDGYGWGFIFSNSSSQPVSSLTTKPTSSTNPYSGSLITYSSGFQFGSNAILSTLGATPYNLVFQTSGNSNIDDFTIVASGGTTTNNGGTLTLSGGELDLTSVAKVISITPVSGDKSTTIATTEFVADAIANISSNPLSGPIVTYGSTTEKTTGGLSLDYYISGPPSSGSVTTDAQVMITNGLAGTANQSTFEIISKNIILNSSYLTTTSPSLDIGNQTDTKNPITSDINFYLNGSSIQDANINVSGGVSGTENGAVIQINAATLDCSTSISNMTVPDVSSTSDSSTKAANTAFVQSIVSKYLPLAGGSLSGNLSLNYSGAVLNLGSSTISDSTPHLYFYSSGNGYSSSDAYISCSGGTTTDNNGLLTICGGSINLAGTTVTAPTPAVADNSTKVATTAFVTTAIKNSSNATKTYTVAELMAIASPSLGTIAFATDGRKPGETVANGYESGSGVPVFYDGTTWLSFGSFQEVTS